MRRDLRMRVSDEGVLEIIDPGMDVLPILRHIQPSFQIESKPLRKFRKARIQACRTFRVGCSRKQLADMSIPKLWRLHRIGICAIIESNFEYNKGCVEDDYATLLDLKTELARRLLENCVLCARRCNVNRLAGEKGICRLGSSAAAADYFIHIAEEPQINPSFLINLDGCALRCRFCQQSALLEPSRTGSRMLDLPLWKSIDLRRARSLSFAGGNPDESLYAILRFLGGMPLEANLPVVWNNHGYCSSETLRLLEGVIDVFLPDFKYGSDVCAQQLSGCSNYVEAAQSGILQMLRQNVDVLVRVLILPGHIHCCHIPVLDWLSKSAGEQVLISIRGQYAPDWGISEQDGSLARRVLLSEVEEVRAYGQVKKLRFV